MITGAAPFPGMSVVETIRAISEREPTPPRRVNASCPRDLEAICLKCLAKPPSQRYPSASALAADLRRFQAGQSVHAHIPGLPTRSWRLCKRHPMAALLVAMVVLLGLLGPIVAVRQNHLYQEAKSAKEDVRKTLYRSDMSLALRDWDEANIEHCGQLLRRHLPVDGQIDYRDFPWYYLWRLWSRCARTPNLLHDENVESLAISPDGNVLAAGCYDGSLYLWDVRERKKKYHWQAHPWRTISVKFSPNGRLMASASTDNEVKLWDAQTGKELALLSGSRAIAFSHDGSLFAHRTSQNSIAIRNTSDSSVQTIEDAHAVGVGCLAFSSDGAYLASGGWDSKVRIWDASSRKLHRELPGEVWIWRIDWSPDGRYLATGDVNGTIRVWNAAAGKLHKTIDDHATTIESLQFSPDGKRLAAGSADSTASVWDVDTGQRLNKLLGHFGEIHSVIFAPQSDALLTGSSDGNVKSWTLDDAEVRDVLEHPSAVSSVSFSYDGQLLATSCIDGQVRIWSVDSGRLVREFMAHTGKSWRVRFIPGGDDQTIVSTGADAFIRIWSATTGEELQRFDSYGNQHDPSIFAITHDSLIAFQATPTTVKIWNPKTQRTVDLLDVGKADDLEFSPNGEWLVVASARDISMWSVQSGEKLYEVVGDARAVRSVAFSPNGSTLVSGSNDRTLKLWPVSSQTDNASFGSPRTLTGHTAILGAVTYSPDGRLLASAGDDEGIRMWDPQTGEQRAVLKGHAGAVVDLAFSPDGKILASAGNDGSARLWRAPPAVVDDAGEQMVDLGVLVSP